MGVRNSVIRRLAVPDVTTTVLTMTLTGLAADSSLAGGDNVRAGRRVVAVGAMLLGGFAGAWLYLRHGAGLPLAVAAAIVLGTAAVFGRAPASRRLDVTT
jgi:CHASE2 domain-containing sensor protein